MAQITYTNKVALNENPEIADINKVTDDDMNEIKSVVNTNDGLRGDLSTLTTTDKSSVVNAINELDNDKASTNEVIISDTQPSASDNKLWIDTGEIGSQVSEITNEYSTSTGLGYSANYVNNLHTYSETEHRVGTWIDNKPIYQKTVILENVNISSGSLVNHDIANVDFIVGWNMIYKTPALPNNTYQNVSYFRSTYSFGIHRVSTTDIQFDTQTDTGNINGMTLYFTMLYTKTTD